MDVPNILNGETDISKDIIKINPPHKEGFLFYLYYIYLI